MNTTILALDLGTHTGWALLQLDDTITSGTENFKPHRFEGGGMRFLRFKQWLNELLAATEPKAAPAPSVVDAAALSRLFAQYQHTLATLNGVTL